MTWLCWSLQEREDEVQELASMMHQLMSGEWHHLLPIHIQDGVHEFLLSHSFIFSQMCTKRNDMPTQKCFKCFL